jgi:hypothetical protein
VCYNLIDEGCYFSYTFIPILFYFGIFCVDYNLLEEVKRVAESAQRVRSKLCGDAHFKLLCHLNSRKLEKCFFR